MRLLGGVGYARIWIMPLPLAPTSQPSQARASLRRWLRVLVWLATASVLLVAVAAMGFRWVVWPKVADLLNDPVALAEQTAPYLAAEGQQLDAFGASAQWRDLFVPTIEVERISLRSAQGDLLAQADHLRADFGLRSLLSMWAGQPVFARLAVERLQVDLVREANGEIRLAGFPLVQSPPDGPGLMAFLAEQGPLAIGRAELHWRDTGNDPAQPVAGRVDLQGLALQLRGDETVIGLDAVALSPLSELLAWRWPGLKMGGRLSQLELGWQGALADLTNVDLARDLSRLQMRAQLDDVSQEGLPQVPAWSGLSGQVVANGPRGSLTLQSAGLSVASDAFMRQPRLDMASVAGSFKWSDLQLAAGEGTDPWPRLAQVDVVLQGLNVSDQGLVLDVSGRWQYRGQGLGAANLKGTVGGLVPTRVAELLPRALGNETHAWIRRAFESGRPVSGNWSLDGPLADFPFRQPGAGSFQARLRFEDLQLHFARQWPVIDGAFVDLRFDGPRMTVSSRQARMLGNPLVVVEGEIADVLASQPMLSLKGRFESNLPTLLAAVNQSPVRNMLGDLTVDAQAKGSASLDLALMVDLHDTDKTTADGLLTVDGADLLLAGGFPAASGLTGALRFSDRGLVSVDWRGQALGGPLQLSHRPAESRETRLAVTGSLEGGALESWLGSALDFPFRGVLAGRTPYEVSVLIRPGQVDLDAQSSLKGLSVRLPVPARKLSDEDWGLRLGLAQRRSATGSRVARWTLRTEKGPLQALVEQRRPGPGATGRSKGLVSLGLPMAEPTLDGTVVRVAAPRLHLGHWLDALDRRVVTPATGPVSPLTGGLTRLEVSAGRMELDSGTALSTVQAQVAQQAGAWVVDLQSQEAVGRINWQPNAQSSRRGVASRGSVTARLTRLWLSPSRGPSSLTAGEAAEDDLQSLTAISQARRWPSVDLVVEDFRRGPQQFGRLTLDAAPSLQEVAWQIRSVVIENPDASLRGSGRWEAAPQQAGKSQTSLDLVLDIKSSEGLLTRLGHPGLLRATPGQLKGQLRWPGAPVDFRVSQLGGQLALDLQQGQFLKAEPGLSKLVSVVNLQSLPKRITLDFRDIFSAGFAYERVRGDLLFSQGDVRTENLRVVGVQASVFIEGTASIMNETQQIRVLVLPELNAGLASLGYALVNPAIGLGSFLAQYVLRDPLRKVLAYEYELTGPWSDPVVKELPRRAPPQADGRGGTADGSTGSSGRLPSK